MKRRITKRLVDSLKPEAKDIFVWDSDLTGFGCKVTPAGRKVYLVQYRSKKQHWKSAPKRLTLGKHGHLTADSARGLAKDALLAVKAGEDPSTVLQGMQRDRTVNALLDRFLDEYLPSKKKPPRPKTVSYYKSLLKCHVRPAFGNKAVNEVTRGDVESLHISLRDRPYMANRVVTVFGQACKYAEVLGWRGQGSNPTTHIERYRELRRGAKKEVMLTAEQMRDLLDAIDQEEGENRADPVACAAIRVAFWTGWRISEVLSLEWENVDLESGSAKLVVTKTADEEFRQLPSEVVGILQAQERVADCPYVFPGRYGSGHLTTVKGPWLAIRKRAGLHKMVGLGALRLHDLRHNVVSWDVSRGVPLEIAGKNIGHQSRESTEVYAHFAPDALKRAADERASAMKAALMSAIETRRAGASSGEQRPVPVDFD